MKVKASTIDWDTDGETVTLPTEVMVDMEEDAEISIEIADAISDRYGFCINSLVFEIVD